MKFAEIPIPKSEKGVSDSLKGMRSKGPQYLKTLVENLHGIDGLDSIDSLHKEEVIALGGGNMSVDYAVHVNGRWMVVKFRSGGARAEAEALRAWGKTGASVVEVFNSGVLPETRGKKR